MVRVVLVVGGGRGWCWWLVVEGGGSWWLVVEVGGSWLWKVVVLVVGGGGRGWWLLVSDGDGCGDGECYHGCDGGGKNLRSNVKR